MVDESRRYLERFKSLAWFHACGEPLDSDEARLFKGNWKGAVRSALSKQSEDAFIDFLNDFRGTLCSKSLSRFNEWDAIYKSKYAVVVSELFSDAKNNLRGFVPPEKVKGDLGYFFLAIEYNDIVNAPFFLQRGKWYLEGRFPCGWEGTPLAGRWIVY